MLSNLYNIAKSGCIVGQEAKNCICPPLATSLLTSATFK